MTTGVMGMHSLLEGMSEDSAKNILRVLGIDPDKDDLKLARKTLAKKYHPDKPGGDADKMKEINTAIDILLGKSAGEGEDPWSTLKKKGYTAKYGGGGPWDVWGDDEEDSEGIYKRPKSPYDDKKPKEVRSCWDNNNDTIDRYTIVLNYPEDGGMWGAFAIGSNPNTFSQYTSAKEGPHLGFRLLWEELPENIQRHVIQRLGSDVWVTVIMRHESTDSEAWRVLEPIAKKWDGDFRGVRYHKLDTDSVSFYFYSKRMATSFAKEVKKYPGVIEVKVVQ
jgi:hypothetical protein